MVLNCGIPLPIPNRLPHIWPGLVWLFHRWPLGRAGCTSPEVFISDASWALERIVALNLVRVYQALSETSMAGRDCQILIIGCGISGVTAAKTLLDAGFKKVRILEATNRSGGRLLTETLGERQVCPRGHKEVETCLLKSTFNKTRTPKPRNKLA